MLYALKCLSVSGEGGREGRGVRNEGGVVHPWLPRPSGLQRVDGEGLKAPKLRESSGRLSGVSEVRSIF